MNLFDYIIIFKLLFSLRGFFKSPLPYSKARLLNYQIRVVLLLFNYSCRNIVLINIINSRGRYIVVVFNSSSFCGRFEYWMRLPFLLIWYWIIFSWARVLLFFRLFRSYLGWSELSSISSLNFINQFVLHSISRLVISWAWLINFLFVNKLREAICIFWRHFLFVSSNFFLIIKFRIIRSWSNFFSCLVSWIRESFSSDSKARHCRSCWFIEFPNFRNF